MQTIGIPIVHQKSVKDLLVAEICCLDGMHVF